MSRSRFSLLHDYAWSTRRIGRAEVTAWWQARSVGAIVQWSPRSDFWLVKIQVGPIGINIEPADEET